MIVMKSIKQWLHFLANFFDSREVIDDDTLVELDRVALGNPAHSVDHPDMHPLHDDEQNGHLQTIDHVFLNPRNGDPSIAISREVQQSAQEEMLNIVCNLAPQVEEDTTEQHDMEPPSQNETEPPSRPNNNPLCTVQVPRNLNPVNEFTSNDHLCYGAFPICFPLGCGLRNPGSIPKADCYHLLNQQSGIIAKDYTVTFILFNESQRHAVVQSLAAKVKASPESFAAFSNIVHDDGF